MFLFVVPIGKILIAIAVLTLFIYDPAVFAMVLIILVVLWVVRAILRIPPDNRSY